MINFGLGLGIIGWLFYGVFALAIAMILREIWTKEK